MIYLAYVDLLIYGVILVLQLKNWKKYKDGNGQEKTRILFVAQIIVLSAWTISSIVYNNPFAFVFSFILAFNALSFYLGWDLVHIFRKLRKK